MYLPALYLWAPEDQSSQSNISSPDHRAHKSSNSHLEEHARTKIRTSPPTIINDEAETC
eukprot:CAMPEP_0194532966 /NCGR_PEP_ID=MMETSP0253-20130528/70707_1 /TAXON_ID=2966 /ORGANISM="Noctiluca scintillans" /LENGTH=58 /DNA_ID=CAMNT_0039378471 /DNA_START=55 /DNA_END=228 /DNA_ORIENTATION=+